MFLFYSGEDVEITERETEQTRQGCEAAVLGIWPLALQTLRRLAVSPEQSCMEATHSRTFAHGS